MCLLGQNWVECPSLRRGCALCPLLSCSDITITLPKAEYAEIAKKALEVDPELMEDKIEKSFETAANRFIVWAEES